MFIIATGDQDHLLRKRAQAGDGARGAGGDGVVVIPHPVQLPDQLDPVFYAAECLGKRANHLIGDQAVHRRNGGHIVLLIVDTGQQDIPQRQDSAAVRPLDHDHAVLYRHAGIHRRLAGKPDDVSPGLWGKGAGIFVVVVEHQLAGLTLPEVDILLRGDIFLHPSVDIQMVGREIGDDGDLGRGVHRHQLEGGELQHRIVLRLHLSGLVQQRGADIAAQMDGVPGGLEQAGNDGGGRCLAVRAGHRNLMTGADVKENLHL